MWGRARRAAVGQDGLRRMIEGDNWCMGRFVALGSCGGGDPALRFVWSRDTAAKDAKHTAAMVTLMQGRWHLTLLIGLIADRLGQVTFQNRGRRWCRLWQQAQE